jgi:hypothetical protein
MRRFVGTSLLAFSAVPFQPAMGLEKFDWQLSLEYK